MPTMPKNKRAPWMPAPAPAWTHRNRWPGYKLNKWKEASAQFKILNPLCSTPGCNGATHSTDHKRPISDGVDPWDQSNWQALCYDCHKKKTVDDRTRAQRRPGKG